MDRDLNVTRTGNSSCFDNFVIPSSSTELSAESPSSSVDGSIHSEPGNDALPCDGNVINKSPDLLFESKFHEEAGASSMPDLVPVSSTTFYNSITGNLEFSPCFRSFDPLISSSYMLSDECHFQESLSNYICNDAEFDNIWIDKMFTSQDEPKEQSLKSDISAETEPHSLTSTMSRDPVDRAMYMHSVSEGCSSPKEVNSISGDVASGEGEGLEICHEQVPLPKKPVMYSPMRKYPRLLLDNFLQWYYPAKTFGKDPKSLYFPIRLRMLAE